MAHQSELEKLQRRYEEKPSQWFAALAEEHRRAGDVALAIDILRRGLKERSNYVSGHIVLGRCLLDQGEEEEAQQVLERVLELDPENIIALKVLGEIAERRGDAAAARSWLERLLEVDPMNEEGRQRLKLLEEVAEPASPDGEAGEAGEAAGAVEAAEAAEAVEAEQDVVVADAGDAPVLEEPPAPLESTVQEPGIADADVVPAETPEPADASAAEVPAENIELVLEKSESALADEVEVMEDVLEPAQDEVVEITGAAVEKDTLLELSPDAGDGPPPEGIVRAEVDRPEPIELTGGPGMVVDSDQATELVESAGASLEDLDSGDRSPLDTEHAPIELEDPVPVEDLEPEALEEAVPAGAEDTSASATEEPQAAPAQDPELVVTETMAEVYVKQGLVDEALNVYRVLLARRPADAELQNRIAELESRAAPAAAASEGPRYRASETGGTSARAFLAQVLAAGAGEEALTELPPAPPPPPSPGDEGEGTEGGVSYDEFFGGGSADQAPPQENASLDEGDRPDAEGDGFKDWLKGLKS